MPAKQVRSIVFTLNNPADADVVITTMQKQEWIDYAIIGKETATTGTPHLQGYIKLKKQKSLKKLNKLCEEAMGKRPFIEPVKGSPQQNITYCSKQGDFIEWGNKPFMGERTDIAEFIAKAKKVRCDEDELKLIEDMPTAWARYYKAGRAARTIDEAVEAKELRKKQYENAELRDWQKGAIELLEKQTNRQVLWLVDTKGNTGKTWLGQYLAATKDAFIIQGGAIRDIAYAYERQSYVVFDLSRQKADLEYIYNIIEHLKDGQLFSSKYESTVKAFCPPKVMVCSNWQPNMELLSKDRWVIRDVPEDFTNPWSIASSVKSSPAIWHEDFIFPDDYH